MKITFLDEYSVGKVDLSPLHSLGNYVGHNTTSAEEILSHAAEAEIIITNKCLLTREILCSLPSLRLICIAATGMNNVDLEAAAELGIEVRNAAGYSTHSVAEATLGAALALHRKIIYFDRFVKRGDYTASGRLFNHNRALGQLHGSRWGIIGLGAIGREVARLAEAFGCEARYFSTSGVAREESIERVERLEELLAWSDIVSLHSPLNSSTEGLITAQHIASMQPHALLINVARGGILDEVALAEALNRGVIAGAAIDVYATEPINADSPLLTLDDPDKILLSPHNAWASTPAIERLIAIIAQNIYNFIAAQ